MATRSLTSLITCKVGYRGSRLWVGKGQWADWGRQDESSQAIHADAWTVGGHWKMWGEGCFEGTPRLTPREELSL